MALAAADATARDQQPSPGLAPTLSLNLSSNNPFRNRASPSPRSPEPSFPFPNGMSKNPFLDPAEAGANTTAVNGSANDSNSNALADDIFGLSVNDRPKTAGASKTKPPPPRNGTLPPAHPRLGSDGRLRGPPRGLNDSPPKRPEHHRRASESSMMDNERRDRSQRDRGDRMPRTESEERRRRERRREREERHRQEKERIRNGEQPASGSRKSRKPKNLDLIDKLDHTGIYGQGLFHHDGPFDACNPHRNAKKDRRAPMQAFPEGSANMALGGAGPLHSRLDLDKFHGRTGEAFTDYQVTKKADTAMSTAEHQREYRRQYESRNQQPQFVHPTDKIEQVHGEESYGLGTSTFLDGAPASRSALQRRESEEQSAMLEGGSLQRKKSLAQRLRGMSNSRPRYPGGELRSPEARYNNGFTDQTPSAGGQIPVTSVSAGGPTRAIYTRENEVNPYEDAFEKKGAEIRFAEQEKPLPTPGSPGIVGNGLTRSMTADNAIRTSTEDEGKPSLLTRMKSLKGGRRLRPERKDSNTIVS